MAKKVIISTPQGNPSGTPLDAAFTMCNDNFTELYSAVGETTSPSNTVLIGQGTDNASLDSGVTTTNFMQIPMSDGIPTAAGGVKGPGALYWELGTTSGITEGLYISDSNGALKLIQLAV